MTEVSHPAVTAAVNARSTAVLAAEKARDQAVAHGTAARDANEAFAASLDVSRANLSLTLQEMGIGKDAADPLALSVIALPAGKQAT